MGIIKFNLCFPWLVIGEGAIFEVAATVRKQNAYKRGCLEFRAEVKRIGGGDV